MREIRFRAWDKKTKQWICVGYAPLGEVTLFGVVEQWLMEHKEPNQTMLDRFGDVEESQFTGLKDKHGNPIYEGDIVKHRNGIKQVVYDDSSASFQMGLSNHVLDQELVPYDGIEVIGNIYQNSELIKQAAT